MFLLDSLLIGGLRFVFDKIATIADQETESVDSLHRSLVEAQLQLEEGEISEEEFIAAERELLARIRELKGTTSGIADAGSFEAIDFGGDK